MRGSYIFQRPSCVDYHNAYGDGEDSLWRSFDVINLTHNHRQGTDKQLADILNRIRMGQPSDEDMKILETRVRSEHDPEVLDCMRICSKVHEAVEFNRSKISNLPGKLYTLEATNFMSTNKNFRSHYSHKKHRFCILPILVRTNIIGPYGINYSL